MARVARRRSVLVVEDDAPLAKAITRVLSVIWPVIVAPSVRQARGEIASAKTLSFAIVDARLGDGFGLDVIALLGQKFPGLPVLATTGHPEEHAFIRAAQELGAEFAPKPSPNVLAFARRQVLRENTRNDSLIRVVDAFAREKGLHLCECELLILACRDFTYEEIAVRRGVSVDTIRSQVQSISRRCGGMTLGEIAAILRAAARLEERRKRLGGGGKNLVSLPI